MKKSTYITLASALAILSSCEKEINVKVPEYKPALVINSSTEAEDTIRVMVGKSISILKYNRNHDLNITDAKVVLYKDQVAIDTLKYDAWAGIYNSKTVAKTGSQYSIKVSSNGFDDASAITTVPSIVPIMSIVRQSQARVDIDGIPQDELKITFDDPATIGDYYIVSIVKESKDNGLTEFTSCINTTDASVESIYNESIDQNTCLSGNAIFFRDGLFNGARKELRLFVNSQFLEPFIMNGDTVRTQVILKHVTEDYFKFQKTYMFASENVDNPFSEPTNVYTNVKNGYGLFSALSYHVEEIK